MLEDGRTITDVLVQELMAELERLMIGSEFPDFLASVAYDYLD